MMAEHSHELKLECGCHFQDYGMGLALQWCPMHESAPDLLAACENFAGLAHEIATWFAEDEYVIDENWYQAALHAADTIDAAICKAQGDDA